MDNSLPKISIVIPVLNSVNDIGFAIESILIQQYNNLEIIIIDGGSTDGTVKKISEYKNQLSHFISEADKGIYDAMNKGISHSTGEWIYFLGSDDTLSEGVLNYVFNEKKFESADVIYGDVVEKGTGKVYGGSFDLSRLLFENPCHQAIFYKVSIIEKFGNFNLRFKIFADYDLNMKLFCSSIVKIDHIEKVIAVYNENGYSKANPDRLFYKEKLGLFSSYLKVKESNPIFRPYFQQEFINQLLFGTIPQAIKFFCMELYFNGLKVRTVYTFFAFLKQRFFK